MDVTCVDLCLQSRLSFVSAVLDFNASLNDVAPASPMLLAVDLIRIEKESFVDEFHLCAVSFTLTRQIEFCKCCV